jgi:hypothetical protein
MRSFIHDYKRTFGMFFFVLNICGVCDMTLMTTANPTTLMLLPPCYLHVRKNEPCFWKIFDKIINEYN